ncbi:hypothetical protein J7K50_00795 [bacterium]|nr:hypothetical protein [bacterium]
MYLLLVILHGQDEWEEAVGVLIKRSLSRVVVLEGSGMGRTTTRNLALRPSFSREIWKHMQTERQRAWVGLSIVKDLETADEIIEEIEEITGDLTNPRTGIICVIPVAGTTVVDSGS